MVIKYVPGLKLSTRYEDEAPEEFKGTDAFHAVYLINYSGDYSRESVPINFEVKGDKLSCFGREIRITKIAEGRRRDGTYNAALYYDGRYGFSLVDGLLVYFVRVSDKRRPVFALDLACNCTAVGSAGLVPVVRKDGRLRKLYALYSRKNNFETINKILENVSVLVRFEGLAMDEVERKGRFYEIRGTRLRLYYRTIGGRYIVVTLEPSAFVRGGKVIKKEKEDVVSVKIFFSEPRERPEHMKELYAFEGATVRANEIRPEDPFFKLLVFLGELVVGEFLEYYSIMNIPTSADRGRRYFFPPLVYASFLLSLFTLFREVLSHKYGKMSLQYSSFISYELTTISQSILGLRTPHARTRTRSDMLFMNVGSEIAREVLGLSTYNTLTLVYDDHVLMTTKGTLTAILNMGERDFEEEAETVANEEIERRTRGLEVAASILAVFTFTDLVFGYFDAVGNFFNLKSFAYALLVLILSVIAFFIGKRRMDKEVEEEKSKGGRRFSISVNDSSASTRLHKAKDIIKRELKEVAERAISASVDDVDYIIVDGLSKVYENDLRNVYEGFFMASFIVRPGKVKVFGLISVKLPKGEGKTIVEPRKILSIKLFSSSLS